MEWGGSGPRKYEEALEQGGLHSEIQGICRSWGCGLLGVPLFMMSWLKPPRVGWERPKSLLARSSSGREYEWVSRERGQGLARLAVLLCPHLCGVTSYAAGVCWRGDGFGVGTSLVPSPFCSSCPTAIFRMGETGQIITVLASRVCSCLIAAVDLGRLEPDLLAVAANPSGWSGEAPAPQA